MMALNPKKMTIVLMILPVLGYTSICTGSSSPSVVPDDSNSILIRPGDRFPDKPVIRLHDHCSRSKDVLLSQWLADCGRDTVVAILNRRLPKHFAQWKTLERIAASDRRDGAVFMLVDLQRIPGRYPACTSQLRSQPFLYYSAGLNTISELGADPTKPVVFFIDKDLTILHITNEYIDNPQIIRYLSMLTDTVQWVSREQGDKK